jgi:hypothetical protein
MDQLFSKPFPTFSQKEEELLSATHSCFAGAELSEDFWHYLVGWIKRENFSLRDILLLNQTADYKFVEEVQGEMILFFATGMDAHA